MAKKKLSRIIKAEHQYDNRACLFIRVHSVDFPDIYEDIYGFYDSMLDTHCRICIGNARDKIEKKVRERINEKPFKLIIEEKGFNFEF